MITVVKSKKPDMLLQIESQMIYSGKGFFLGTFVFKIFLDKNLNVVGRGAVEEFERGSEEIEAEIHTRIRKDAAELNELFTNLSSNPELNPPNYSNFYTVPDNEE